MNAVKEEHSILRLIEGIASGQRIVTMDAQDAQRVLDRVKKLEDALAGLIRSFYERTAKRRSRKPSHPDIVH